jgi:hypothetical protein
VIAGTFGPRVALSAMAVSSGLIGLSYLAHPRLRALPAIADASRASLGVGIGPESDPNEPHPKR